MLSKVIQMEFCFWKSFENLFLTRNIQFEWLLKAKYWFLNHEQNICPGQFQYCPGQKVFCLSRWRRQESKNNLMYLHSTIVTLAGHLMQSYFSSKSTNRHHMSWFLEAAMGPTVLSLLYDRHSVKFVIRIFRMPWKRKLMWDRIGNLFSPFEFHVKWWNGTLKSLFLVKQQSDSQSETNNQLT